MQARYLAFCVLIPCLFAPLLAQEPALDLEAARARLAQVAKKMEKVERLQASYIQYQESLLLAEPLVSQGTLHLRAEPGCLLLEVGGDRPVQVRSDQKSHQMYWPREKTAERWLFRSNELARALLRCFSAEVGRLEEAFEIRGYASQAGQSKLRLVPREKKLQRHLAALVLEIDETSQQLVGIAHENAEGEHVRLVLSKIDLAPAAQAQDALFDAALPSDVRLLVHEVKEPPTKQARLPE